MRDDEAVVFLAVKEMNWINRQLWSQVSHDDAELFRIVEYREVPTWVYLGSSTVVQPHELRDRVKLCARSWSDERSELLVASLS